MRVDSFKSRAPLRWHIAAIPLACLLVLSTTDASGFFWERSPPSELTVGWDNMPRSFDPRYALDANSQYLEDLVHCSLFAYDENGVLIPEAAADWRWLAPTTLEVSIKEGITFRSGRSLTATEVEATYRSFLRDDINPPPSRRGAFRLLLRIERDGNRLRFQLSEPDASFLQNLVVGILPAEVAAASQLQDPVDLDGCGPFHVSAVRSHAIELAANPRYGLGPSPRSPRIRIAIIQDEITRFAKLRTGELDIVQNGIDRDKLPKLQSLFKHLRVERRPGLATTYLGFNIRDKRLADAKVRQAIAHAIDRDSIIRHVLRGHAVPANTLLTPESPFYLKELRPIAHDPAAAGRLLDEAGFPLIGPPGEQQRFALSLKTTTDLTRLIIAKAIASQLRQVGIRVDVESLEWSRFKSDVDKGLVQAWTLSWIGFKDPDIYRHAFGSEAFPPAGGNRGRFSSPALDGLLARGLQAVEPGDRAEAYAEAQRLIARELPYAFLWHEDRFAVVNRRVRGFSLYADGRYRSLAKAYVASDSPE